MNVLCPLDDDCLPLEAANLKTRQVRACTGVEACAWAKGPQDCKGLLQHWLMNWLLDSQLQDSSRGWRPCCCLERGSKLCAGLFLCPVLCCPVCQVEVALSRLKDSELDHDDHLVCLEALARLAWSDDSVRQVRARADSKAGWVVLAAQLQDSLAKACAQAAWLAHAG